MVRLFLGPDRRLLPELEFGAFLSYSPRGDSAEAQLSRYAMNLLKNEGFVPSTPRGPQIPMSEWVARMVEQNRSTLPFADLFQRGPVLVPAPKSSLMRPDSLWVPKRLAAALVKSGLGSEVALYLRRIRAVPKAASSAPRDRPKAAQHYETMVVELGLSKPPEIVVVDDVVTTGAMLLGSASLLAKAFPNSRIRGFAAMRAITLLSDFKDALAPCVGRIEFFPWTGMTQRSP